MEVYKTISNNPDEDFVGIVKNNFINVFKGDKLVFQSNFEHLYLSENNFSPLKNPSFMIKKDNFCYFFYDGIIKKFKTGDVIKFYSESDHNSAFEFVIKTNNGFYLPNYDVFTTEKFKHFSYTYFKDKSLFEKMDVEIIKLKKIKSDLKIKTLYCCF